MKLIQIIKDFFRPRHVPWGVSGMGLSTPPAPAMPLEAHAAELGEQVRLAHEIADDAARAEIECECGAMQLGTRSWYDTTAVEDAVPEYQAGVDRALRYLDLRGRVQRHPVEKHLVRFAR